jgi:hypothetical protein
MSIFVPSAGLLVAVGDKAEAQKFSLASRDWFDLQNHVNAVLALPSNIGEYTIRYGDPTSGDQMKKCFEAMEDLRQTTMKYGNPRILRSKILKDPNLLASGIRPKNDAYAATLWTIQLAHRDALSLASALKSIPASARNEDPKNVVAGIKSLFLDADQIVDKMRQTKAQLDALVNEFEALYKELEKSQQEMEKFTGKASKTMTALSTEIGETEGKIAQLEKDRQAAYDKWLALTIAACVVAAAIAIVGIAVSVILAAPTAGASAFVGSAISVGVAGAVGTALGIAAGIARTGYEDLVKEVETKKEFLKKRIAYRSDLGALDKLMKFSLPSSEAVQHGVGVVRDAWGSSINEIQARVQDLTVGSLSDGPWLNSEAMAAAAANWTTVDDALKAFSVGSFVDAELVSFGAPLPKDDPKWLENLKKQHAA